VKDASFLEKVTYNFEAKIHRELEGSCQVCSSAGGLDTLGGTADESRVATQAFGVGDNAAAEISTGCAWDGASCTT
jgi:hypothetical protein